MGTSVDTLRVGGNISGADRLASGWRYNCDWLADGCLAVRDQARELQPGVWLHVLPGKDSRSAWVEGSVPRFVNPEGVNWPAASVEAAREVGEGWMGLAGEFVQLSEEPRVSRVDVVRDLDVGRRVTEVLNGVGGMVAGGRCVRALYRDGSANHALTVWARTKRAGGGRLYDKERESGCRAAAGVVRFEGQERRAGLNRAGVLHLADLADEPLDGMLRARWDWCRFGERVLGRDDWTERVLAKEEWRWDTRLKMVGWMKAGYPAVGSRSTTYRLRERLRQIGQPAEGPGGWRLDLDRGLVAA